MTAADFEEEISTLTTVARDRGECVTETGEAKGEECEMRGKVSSAETTGSDPCSI